MDTQSFWILAVAVFLLAGSVKGLVGIGLPATTIGVLSQFADPRQAIALSILPVLISNIWQVHKNRMFAKALKRYWLFCVIMAVGIWYFAQFAALVSKETMSALVGSVMILFVLTSLLTGALSLPERLDKPAQIVAGALAGIMGGLTSLWAPPLVVYLLSQRLQKDEFVGALGFMLLAGSLPLMLGYSQAGLMSPSMMAYSAAMIVPTLLGVFAGEFGRNYLNGQQFRGLLLFVFLVLGANLIRIAFLA